MSLTRQRDNIHWTSQNLLSYNKTFNFAVSGRGPGKSTDILRYMMKQHKQGYAMAMIKRKIVDINDGTISDLQNTINILLPDEEKIALTYKRTDIKTGNLDIYIEGGELPFFRMIALSNPKYRLKGLAFDRPLSLIVFDEYKISGSEKYLPDEYSKFQELYGTLARFGIGLPDGKIKPPRCIFLGNNYSLTDPYIANMHIPVNKIQPGKILVGGDWAFEDIKISEELKALLLAQNPLFNFGDDAYNKYALEGISVSDERMIIIDKQPDNFSLQYIFYWQSQYIGVYMRNDPDAADIAYWIGTIDSWVGKRREVACFDFDGLIDGNYLLSRSEKSRFYSLTSAFRYRLIGFKSLLEAYIFEQIYELL